MRTGLLQKFDLGQQLRRFVFKQRALSKEILFRIFAGAILEVQVAQVLVELFLALQQKIEPRLLVLAGEGVLRPEGVDERARGQASIRRSIPGSLSLLKSLHPFPGFAANLLRASRSSRIGSVRSAARSSCRPTSADQQNRSQQRGRKDGERSNPGHQVEAVRGGRGQHDGAVLGGEAREDLLDRLCRTAMAARQLVAASRPSGAAHVVAFAQQLRAAAGTHQAMAKVVEPRAGVAGAQREADGDGEQRVLPLISSKN